MRNKGILFNINRLISFKNLIWTRDNLTEIQQINYFLMRYVEWSLYIKPTDHKLWLCNDTQFVQGWDTWHFKFQWLKVLYLSLSLSLCILPHSPEKLWTRFILLSLPCLLPLQRYSVMILLFKIKTAWTLAESNEIPIFHTMATTSSFCSFGAVRIATAQHGQ